MLEMRGELFCRLRDRRPLTMLREISMSTLRHAVLQTDLSPPGHDQLLRAFRAVPGLTPYDASILGNDAFGVLVKNFSAEQAAALHSALRSEEIETEIVEQSLLPEMPPANFVQRLECAPEHLLVFDPLGNSFPLEWRHVFLIAAGAVRVSDFVRREVKRPVKRYHGSGHVSEEVESDSVTREEQNVHLLGEILITGAALRYSFRADKFNFGCLGARRTDSLVGNFAGFLRDLAQFAPHAGLNRGASGLARETPEVFSYPTKNAFHEEIVWMLWQIKKRA